MNNNQSNMMNNSNNNYSINSNNQFIPQTNNQLNNQNSNISFPNGNLNQSNQVNNLSNQQLSNNQGSSFLQNTQNQPSTNQQWGPNQTKVENQLTDSIPQNNNVINNQQMPTNSNNIDPFTNTNQTQKPTTYVDMLEKEGINIIGNESKFINNKLTYNETSINDLNVQGNYNNILQNDYRNDPRVIENLKQKEKKTITITKELKIVIIIVVILFIFIFIIPYIFDFIREIRY